MSCLLLYFFDMFHILLSGEGLRDLWDIYIYICVCVCVCMYTNCVCTFVTLCIQHAMCIYHIVICVLLTPTVSLNIISKNPRFSKKNIIECKMCVSNFSTTFA